MPARVIAFGPGQGFDWTVTIDIGRSSGVAVDQTVTSAAGLVGRVVHADASTRGRAARRRSRARVSGVRDTRSGELALATGAGSGGFTVTPLAPTADLRVGDQLETGPAGSSTFAVGLLLGTITAVHTSDRRADRDRRARDAPDDARPRRRDHLDRRRRRRARDGAGAR